MILVDLDKPLRETLIKGVGSENHGDRFEPRQNSPVEGESAKREPRLMSSRVGFEAGQRGLGLSLSPVPLGFLGLSCLLARPKAEQDGNNRRERIIYYDAGYPKSCNFTINWKQNGPFCLGSDRGLNNKNHKPETCESQIACGL